MKRFTTILLSAFILLSSGLFQFVVHVCPEKGAMLSEAHCNMHQQHAVKDCCRKGRVIVPEKDDCCTDSYVFAVTAKYNPTSTFRMAKTFSGSHHFSNITVTSLQHYLSKPLKSMDYSPPEPGRLILITTSKLTI